MRSNKKTLKNDILDAYIYFTITHPTPLPPHPTHLPFYTEKPYTLSKIKYFLFNKINGTLIKYN